MSGSAGWPQGPAHFTPYAPLYNATGRPAVSVPPRRTAGGPPIGVMLGGRYGDEAAPIALPAQLEPAWPGADRHPEVWASH